MRARADDRTRAVEPRRRPRGRWLLLMPLVIGTAPHGLAGQEPGILAVRVVAEEAAEPIEGARVRLSGTDRSVVTNANGRAILPNVPAGRAVLEIERIGYRAARQPVEVVAGRMVEVRVEMALEPVAVRGVEATAERRVRQLELNGFYERRRMGIGQFRDREHFDRVADRTSRLSHALAGIPTLRLRPAQQHGMSGGYVVQSTRGRFGCAAQIFLNGARLGGSRRASIGGGNIALAESPPNLDELLGPHQVEAIEWYGSSAQIPVQFRETGGGPTDPECGVLVIWTRTGG